MKQTLILVLLASSFALAQDQPKELTIRTGGSAGTPGNFFFTSTVGPMERSSGTVQGAPYTATITNESIQTLADGNRIVQTSSGSTARDSLGRTRQDAALPPIGNLAPANAPHLVFLQDPVAQASYVLNLTDKTAMKGPSMGMMPPTSGAFVTASRAGVASAVGIALGPQAHVVTMQKIVSGKDSDVRTEDLGSQVMEGVQVTGVRTTHTIPAGEIGNDKPIEMVTEVWTSPDLKTVVYSKRNDPRMGEQTFKLTNIVRAEPDPALFTVPADCKVIDGAEPIIYHTNQ